MASLVDLVGSAAIFTTGAPMSGVSVEINVSYLDAAYVDVGTSSSYLDSLLFVSVTELVFFFSFMPDYSTIPYACAGHFSFLPFSVFFVS